MRKNLRGSQNSITLKLRGLQKGSVRLVRYEEMLSKKEVMLKLIFEFLDELLRFYNNGF